MAKQNDIEDTIIVKVQPVYTSWSGVQTLYGYTSSHYLTVRNGITWREILEEIPLPDCHKRIEIDTGFRELNTAVLRSDVVNPRCKYNILFNEDIEIRGRHIREIVEENLKNYSEKNKKRNRQ